MFCFNRNGVFMKTIAIITNCEKDKQLIYTKILSKSILDRGGSVRLLSELSEATGTGEPCPDEDAVLDGSDMVIVLGGDGTFLKAARKVYRRGLPILGINLGNLGFLTEVDRNDIEDAVDHIFRGDFKIEERMMLEAVVKNAGRPEVSDVALNDVVITRGAISRLLHVKLYIN
jgi:NAD+ kinase